MLARPPSRLHQNEGSMDRSSAGPHTSDGSTRSAPQSNPKPESMRVASLNPKGSEGDAVAEIHPVDIPIPPALLLRMGVNAQRMDVEIGGIYDDKISTMAIYCLLYTSPSPRDRTRSRMPSSA